MKQLTVLATIAMLSACASSELPQAAVAEAQAEITAAETLGASDNNQAGLYLKLAKDQLAQAKEFADDGDDEEARFLLDRAVIDAKLAIALTRKAEADSNARKVLNEIKRLSQK